MIEKNIRCLIRYKNFVILSMRRKAIFKDRLDTFGLSVLFEKYLHCRKQHYFLIIDIGGFFLITAMGKPDILFRICPHQSMKVLV
ncbi:uncharacterized protein TOL2_C13080 [Desulfobacula toluolica Tol2]|uniref:Uncharacterized protein n=1 Tax=Desulfobacula toluolica (strain DSM 7467 / Tol2) TaxID=651182 RepID=K0NEJ0_DESTT|nr:uncharacterized protein TOL2_C13080 [Desulfobacula toluolica Tol2]